MKSASELPKMLRNKLLEYLDNGAQLGWLIDPDTRSVSIYRPEREAETLIEIDTLSGEGLVAGFVLDLTSIWNPLA